MVQANKKNILHECNTDQPCSRIVIVKYWMLMVHYYYNPEKISENKLTYAVITWVQNAMVRTSNYGTAVCKYWRCSTMKPIIVRLTSILSPQNRLTLKNESVLLFLSKLLQTVLLFSKYIHLFKLLYSGYANKKHWQSSIMKSWATFDGIA